MQGTSSTDVIMKFPLIAFVKIIHSSTYRPRDPDVAILLDMLSQHGLIVTWERDGWRTILKGVQNFSDNVCIYRKTGNFDVVKLWRNLINKSLTKETLTKC